MEEALTRIMDSMDEQNEQILIRMSEQETAVRFEGESLLEEINRNRQEVSQSDEYLAKNLSRMTLEAKQREQQLRGDMKRIGSQKGQTLGALNTRIDTMMERCTQAKLD